MRCWFFAIAVFVAINFAMTIGTAQGQRSVPQVLDPDWRLEQVVSEPDLVTPVGCCFDAQGRLLVVESHTHFPPEDYSGAKEDRIYLFDDSDGDGTLDRKRIFYQGGVATMGIALLPDGWVAVATRSEVTKIRDSDGDDVADEREVLLTLETEASYPHNGLAGLALGPDGWLYAGQGENLGDRYRLVGSDGAQQIGGGEGGNIFRCRIDGSGLTRIATGFWNPFGLLFDSADRLWAVGNDPDAMPPCRLLHVVPAGDYGFQFRFGRAGTHPLQSWNGELPGTLPMAAGTGEAPCTVVERDGALWVTGWGSNRIERYRLEQSGASWTSRTEVIVQGNATFRPVGMAVAPDGSIYFTDWVDRSYPVHGKGGLWRLSKRTDSSDLAFVPKRSEAEKQATRLRTDRGLSFEERLAALDDTDPFIHHAAVSGLVATGQIQRLTLDSTKTAQQRVGMLSAFRWQALCDPDHSSAVQQQSIVESGLLDAADDVVVASVRWATENDDKRHLPAIRSLLERTPLSPQLFSAVVASIAYLESGSAARGKRDPVRERLLVELAERKSAGAVLRAMAIRLLPPEAEVPSNEQLGEWVASERDRRFGGEIVRLLAARGDDQSLKRLASIAANEMLHEQVRADAIAALAPQAAKYSAVLTKFSRPNQSGPIRNEARRLIRRGRTTEVRPAINDLDAWDALMGEAGDREAGRRVFFRTTCAKCHLHSGRGSAVGPDLTNLSTLATRKRILESILQPSREVGPLYVPWQILTTDGQILTGMKLDKAGQGKSLVFLGAEGAAFEVPLEDIEVLKPVSQSIMPTGLEQTMSLDELRDLIVFLQGDNLEQKHTK